MKEQILNIIKNSDKALSVEEINDYLGNKDIDTLKEIIKILDELEKD